MFNIALLNGSAPRKDLLIYVVQGSRNQQVVINHLQKKSNGLRLTFLPCVKNPTLPHLYSVNLHESCLELCFFYMKKESAGNLERR